MLIHELQQRLESLYETPIAYNIYDFLITDAKLARMLDGVSATPNNERLLIRQSEDDLDLSLYIDESVLRALRSARPGAGLEHIDFNAFQIALEGVSHFNYLIWNAHHGRQVTQLELELQGEVDKFVTALMLFDLQGSDDHAAVHRVLFEDVSFLKFDDPDIEQRYRDANRFAGQYCQKLQLRYPAQHRQHAFLNELRRFYRLGQNDKIRAIRHH